MSSKFCQQAILYRLIYAFGYSVVSIEQRIIDEKCMNIYVGNLSYGVTDDDLQQLFAEYGTVVNVNLIKDRDTGNSKGFGFIEMENQADSEKAIKELDGNLLKGRNIKVNQTRPKNDRAKPKRRSW